MFFLLEASLVSFLPSSLAGCLTGWWHRKAEEPSELSSWTGQAAPAPQLPSSGRPRPLQTCFPTSQVHIQVSVYFRNLKREVLFSGYPLFILACFLDVFLACWTSGWGKALSWPFPKAACGWGVSRCIGVLRPYSQNKKAECLLDRWAGKGEHLCSFVNNMVSSSHLGLYRTQRQLLKSVWNGSKIIKQSDKNN